MYYRSGFNEHGQDRKRGNRHNRREAYIQLLCHCVKTVGGGMGPELAGDLQTQ